MKLFAKIFTIILLLTVISGIHVLKHFDQDIAKIKVHLQEGDTSQVFSIFMKMLHRTTHLYKELSIPHPELLTTQEHSSCNDKLHQLANLFQKHNWVQLYQVIYPKLHQLATKCTNADFMGREGSNGFDNKCAGCVVITRVMENYITLHRKDVASFVEKQFCTMFEGLVKPTCEAFIHYAGPRIIKGLLNKQNSDVICQGSGMCKNPQCKIVDTRNQDEFQSAINKLYGQKQQYEFSKPSPWQWLIDYLSNHFGDKHLPVFDLDTDTFSDISTFRGYNWKGSDCNQFDSKVYPGRKNGKKTNLDHDCNNIFGVDQKGKSQEEKLCGNSTRLGVVVAGDSAGAHFSIPPKFFNASMMQHGTFNDLLTRVADELDLPHESAYTGHTNTSYLTHSIYKKLRKWNLCNHNDFQNIGVNGGDSGNSWGNIKALHRDQQNDHPVLFFLELIGNDVCGSNPHGYTPVDKFKQNILKLLEWLDTTLPKGSHVVVLGLADGDLLADNLLGLLHPLDIKYDQLYDFLNCLKISPCAGWLNTNHTIRLQTTAWAKKLSNVYKQIVSQSHTFKNYDLVYYDFPTLEIFNRGILQNKMPQDMIEPSDGFHPSGLFNSYLADWLWYKITTDQPEWFGDQNPHNPQIKKLFGLDDLI